jgi:hypothetical protein
MPEAFLAADTTQYYKFPEYLMRQFGYFDAFGLPLVLMLFIDTLVADQWLRVEAIRRCVLGEIVPIRSKHLALRHVDDGDTVGFFLIDIETKYSPHKFNRSMQTCGPVAVQSIFLYMNDVHGPILAWNHLYENSRAITAAPR